ncbi:DUF6406 domain-containing protein [Streptomyces sp. NPDC055992]|uniref:DUF6406 domain-containing protein n=1 Tax=Streptomyces sp. NPDC055992 TaxID=3345673 RepID=UPI0035D53B1E
MTAEVFLRNAVPAKRDGVRFVVRGVHLPDGLPVSVDLVVVTDQERDHLLGIGDTFPVREETWVLDRVENLPTLDWRVVLRKVE